MTKRAPKRRSGTRRHAGLARRGRARRRRLLHFNPGPQRYRAMRIGWSVFGTKDNSRLSHRPPAARTKARVHRPDAGHFRGCQGKRLRRSRLGSAKPACTSVASAPISTQRVLSHWQAPALGVLAERSGTVGCSRITSEWSIADRLSSVERQPTQVKPCGPMHPEQTSSNRRCSLATSALNMSWAKLAAGLGQRTISRIVALIRK